MRRLLLVGLLCAGIVFGMGLATRTHGRGGAARFNTLIRAANLMVERGRRAPFLALTAPGRASLVSGGGKVETRQSATLRLLERRSLGVTSPVVAISEGLAGGLVVGTFDEGVFRLGHGEEVASLAIDPRVNDLAHAADGTLYVATNGGAFRIGLDGRTERLGGGAFTAVALWREKAWFTSRKGLSVVDGAGLWTRGAAQGFGADSPAALADCGELLCVGASDGLWTFDGTRVTRHSTATFELPAEWVTAVAKSEGGIWAGTFDGGLSRLGKGPARRFAPGDGLPDGRVSPHALASIGGTVFAGTPTGIVAVRGEVATLLDGVGIDPAITAVAPARAGGIWVGQRGVISRYAVEEVLQ